MTKKKADEPKPEAELDSSLAEDLARESEGESPVVDRMAQAVADVTEGLGFDFDTAYAGAELRDACLEVLRHRAKPYGDMSEKEQRETSRLIAGAVDSFLATAVREIAAEGRPSIHARLEKFTAKGGKYQAALVAQGGPDLAAELARLDGHEVLIISADATAYQRERPAPIAPDQAPLVFGEPASGLVEGADEEEGEERLGEGATQTVIDPGTGTATIINAATGSVLSERPATEAEIAEAQAAGGQA